MLRKLCVAVVCFTTLIAREELKRLLHDVPPAGTAMVVQSP